MNASLPALVDVPDLEAALAGDADGSFHAGVSAYLQTQKDQIQQSLNAGLPRDEFECLSRLLDGIQTTEKVLDFLVKTKAFTGSV